ncbi:hypothetical protein C8J36_104137 [Rhizobium sp. PP-F2F-G48]|uniref:hypothetical protein n=1 Tax=Rhizobium sp. PP-F2F-G48 TaxID=2135651 RepID=UPI001051C27C|nr:hypothetical protein [Rhizobium sp. PP-F2F-G48]TCM54945.1 hypothetical protein C8J36_104137 [Rhizobium sp. PP-F2F-G48]
MGKPETVEDIQRELLVRVRTEGVVAAYEASLAICRDPKAPAPARATASATIFRVAGLFDRKDGDKLVEPHEMTADQLNAEIKRLGERQSRPADDSDIFG